MEKGLLEKALPVRLDEKTQRRVLRAIEELTKGYHQTLEEVVNGAIEKTDRCGLVLVKDIPFFSLCEHHLLPFFGSVTIGYFPQGKILGLSKFARIVELYSRRLQIQERMTEQIGKAIEEVLSPRGVGVIVKARHLCMEMRGVKKPAETTTSYLGEALSYKPDLREEFFSLI